MCIRDSINLLSGACGAEIEGINLKNISEKNIKIIKNLLFEHKVIFFRNQEIDQQEQINLSKCFGPLETHAYTKGLKEFPEIVRIIKNQMKKIIGVKVGIQTLVIINNQH